MTKIISGCVYADGRIFSGEGFEVEVEDYGYKITFKDLTEFPDLVAQPWKTYGDGTTCQTVGYYTESSIAVLVETTGDNGEFKKTAFNFIAVSHE